MKMGPLGAQRVSIGDVSRTATSPDEVARVVLDILREQGERFLGTIPHSARISPQHFPGQMQFFVVSEPLREGKVRAYQSNRKEG